MKRETLCRLSGAIVISAVVGSSADAQKVLLELRPRVGDTISMRLDQQSEVTGKREGTKASPSSMVNTSVTFSRAVIESAVQSFTTILAITDSVLMSSNDQRSREAAAAAQKQLQGRRVRLNVAPDGQVGMPADGSAPGRMSRTASLIPATFPSKPVQVGDKWSRQAPLPAGTSQLGTGMAGRVTASFRLDSLTRNGELAWVSMHGDLSPDPRSRIADGLATVDDGSVDGWMVIDHARGWLTESMFTIVAHSTLRPSFGVVAQPMYFETRLTQHLRLVGK